LDLSINLSIGDNLGDNIGDNVNLTLSDGQGFRHVVKPELKPMSFAGFPKLPGLAAADSPLYLRNNNDNYWFEQLPSQLLYVQFNDVANKESQSLKQFSEQIQQLIIEGEVADMVLDLRHNSGGDGSDFNGVLTATIFDKPVKKQTLGTEDPVMTYESRNAIFRGDVSVKNGLYEFDFIVPKNISYNYGDGKISLYAISNDYTSDASGSNGKIKIGGTESNSLMDDLPPEISLFMNDTTFMFGGTVGRNPILIAKIFDENGITLSGNEIGQGVILTLDKDSEIDVSNFYQANIDSYQSGTLSYPLSDLEEGTHQLLLKVWDTHNNSSESYIEFVVADKNTMYIQNLLNYPNPFRDETFISFEHNRSGEDLEITLEIFDSYGKIVKQISGYVKHSDFRVDSLKWDGRNSSGEKMRSGLYIYRVFVRSLRDGAKNHKYDKMVIIN